MEKKTSPTQLSYAPTSLAIYRDDLEEIVSILGESCKQVIIEDNEYKFDSLDEVLDKRGPNPRQLSINSREPLVIFNIRIKPGYTTLGTSGDGDNLAPYYRVKQILESRKRKDLAFLCSGFPALVLTVALLILWNLLNKKFPGTGSGFWIRFSLIIGILINFIIVQYRHGQGAFTKIILKKKHEEESFWSRNKDEIFRQLISNILAFGLGLVAAYFLFRQGIK